MDISWAGISLSAALGELGWQCLSRTSLAGQRPVIKTSMMDLQSGSPPIKAKWGCFDVSKWLRPLLLSLRAQSLWWAVSTRQKQWLGKYWILLCCLSCQGKTEEALLSSLHHCCHQQNVCWCWAELHLIKHLFTLPSFFEILWEF